MKTNLLLSLLALCTFNLFAQSIPVDPNVRIGTLDNGMTYYIQKNAKPENRAEIRLAVKVGSVMEDDDQQGLAHFVEHMAFNGTKHFEKNELVHYLESTGAKFGPDLNAYTSFDETVYMLQVRTDDADILSKGLLIFEDWAGGILFEGEEIDKERGVIKSEWRSRLSPNQRMQNEYFPVMYKGSKYADRLPIGKMDIIENAPYDALRRYYRDWYRPDLMAIIVVGDIDVMAMEKEIKTRFSKLTNPTVPRERTRYNVPRHQETLVSIVSDKEAAFNSVRMMTKLPKFEPTTMQDMRQSMLHRLYNGMLNNRLGELTQLPEPPYSFAYSGYGGDIGDIDQYSSFARTSDGKTMVGFEAMLTEIERAKRFGFTATELEREKENILTGAESAVKEQDKMRSGRLAMRYVYHFLENNPIASAEQRLAMYKQYLPTIAIDEVNGLSEKWLIDENRVIVVSAPEKDEFPLPTEQDVLAVLDRVKTMKLEPYVDEIDDTPLFDQVLKPGSIVDEVSMPTIGVHEWKLSNGVRVVWKSTDFQNDEIMMRASSEGGHSIYDDSVYPSARFASGVINEAGIATFDNIQLEKKLTGKLVSVGPYIGELYEGFYGSASPSDLETMFQLVYLYFTAPREDDDAYRSFYTKQAAIFKNLMSNPDYYFSDFVTKTKTNDHPRRGFPTTDDLDLMDYKKAIEIYKDRFADASDFTFYFVGNIDENALRNFSTTYLANLPSTNREETWKDVGADYQNGIITKSFNRGEAEKTQVHLSFHGPIKATGENRYKMQSTLNALRVKLREELREEKGGVYGVRVSGGASKRPKETYNITISFNAQPDRAADLVATAKAVVRKYQAEAFDEKDIQKVREKQTQEMIKNLKENRFWMNKIQDAYEDGWNPELISMETLEERQKMLTGENLLAGMKQYFDWNNYFEIIMAPEVKDAD